VSAAARLYARLEPIAYDDDGTLQDLTTALMAPVEIAEIARDTDTLVAWEALWDPDECPAELLDWLAIANGVILPPSALTTAEKRYRIKQAAGRYRGTPRALVEEVQLVLTGTKTVYMAFKTADRWTYAVGTIDAETPDEDAVEAAIERQNPAFMLWERLLTSDWSWMVLAPTLIGTRATVDGVDTYTIGAAPYPTWTSVASAFTDWTDLVAGP
jgi:phage tail P2-like protein